MSFILDALKRSERERLARQSPSLNSVTSGPAPQGTRWVMVLMVAGLLINLALAGFWIFFHDARQDASPPPSLAISVARNINSEGPWSFDAFEKMGREITGAEGASSVAEPLLPEIASAPEFLNSHAPDVARNVREIYEEDEPDEENLSERSLAPKQEVTLQNQDGASVPLISDLSLDDRSRLPSFQISLYAYSSLPEERFIVMNGKKAREGDEPIVGVKLLHIGADSVIFDANGQRFRIER
jgi:general secretion pathway protein B